MGDSGIDSAGGRRSRRRVLLLATAGLPGLAGCLKSTIERAADRQNRTPSPTPSPRPSVTVTVSVGPGDRFGFYPGTDTPLRITRGTTVLFVWRTDSHNIVVDRQPEGATWQGTPGGVGEAYETGYRHEHTFTVTGTYRFHCAPHETIGATGAIEVVPERTSTATPE